MRTAAVRIAFAGKNNRRARSRAHPAVYGQCTEQKKNATSGHTTAQPRRVSLTINKNGFRRAVLKPSSEDAKIIAPPDL